MMLEVKLAHKEIPETGGQSPSLSTNQSIIPEHFLGFGLGLRTDHFQEVLDTLPNLDWFEVVSENFMVGGCKP